MQNNWQRSFVNALGTVIYIGLVATFMTNIEKIFGPGPDNFFAPMTALLLLVISALITGSLVVGQPIMLYLDGKKKESVDLLVKTGVWLVVFFILLALVIYFR